MASAGVGGALVGLLFVAVSVVPHTVRTSTRATVRLRPSSALSAFTSALLLSLLVLIPGLSVARAVTGLSIAGLVTMVGLLVLLVREVRTAKALVLVQAVVAVVSQGVVYGFELAQGIALQARPDDVGVLDNVAVLVVILFALGIERAWEYVGAGAPGLVGAVFGSFRQPGAVDGDRATDPGAAPASEPGEGRGATRPSGSRS